jgi:signal transduction histidine kinase
MLTAVFLAGSVTGIYRLRVRSVEAQKLESERQVHERTREIEELFERTKELAIIEERNRLARDLHDSVTQVLYSASLIAELLPQRFQRDPEAAIESAVELRRLTHGALAEMRTMLLELRPAGIVNLPLGELLTELIEAISSRSELTIRLVVDNVPLLPADVQISFYRIAQEALNNVAKHAQGCKVVLSLSATPPFGLQRLDQWDGEIGMVISDDGTGFSLEDQGVEHLGLGIMRERAAAIGAMFALESRPGQGTRVALTWHS